MHAVAHRHEPIGVDDDLDGVRAAGAVRSGRRAGAVPAARRRVPRVTRRWVWPSRWCRVADGIRGRCGAGGASLRRCSSTRSRSAPVCAAHGFATDRVMSFRYRESIVATISGGTSQIQRHGIARSMGLRCC